MRQGSRIRPDGPVGLVVMDGCRLRKLRRNPEWIVCSGGGLRLLRAAAWQRWRASCAITEKSLAVTSPMLRRRKTRGANEAIGRFAKELGHWAPDS